MEEVLALEQHGGDYHGEEEVKGPVPGERPHHWAVWESGYFVWQLTQLLLLLVDGEASDQMGWDRHGEGGAMGKQ